MGYLSHFIVYMLAMLGLIILALYVYKKFSITSITSNKFGNLKIEETLSLTPRKTLFVVRSGNERFLIAGDTERTTLISKLEETSSPQSEKESLYTKNFEIKDSSEKQPIMKNLVQKLSGDKW